MTIDICLDRNQNIISDNIISHLNKSLGNINNLNKIEGGKINETYECYIDGSKYIIRIFPKFFQEKKYELYFLNLLKSLGYPVPEVSAYNISGSENFICYKKIDGTDLEKSIGNIQYKLLLEIYNDVLKLIKSIGENVSVNHTGYLHDKDFDGSFNVYLLTKINKFYSNSIHENNTVIINACSYLQKNISNHKINNSQLTIIDNQNKNIIVDNDTFKGIIDFDFLIGGDYLLGISNMFIHTYNDEVSRSCLIEAIKKNFTHEEQEKIFYFSIFRLIEYIDFLSDDIKLLKGLNERQKKTEYYINILLKLL